ncbi:MAG: ABC transporter ATP-binding protein [Calothrix sp. MO_192.B10]|nr:ABC transporter ATP-binding protein [Calothrix sp. MO_192.B10]
MNPEIGDVLLQFRDVSKSFVSSNLRKVQALANITFSLNQGEFIVIIGPSGCGKSTVLRLAAGLDKPSSGEVLYHGERIKAPERRRGLVFQSYSVFPWLTVRENIEFGLNDTNLRLKQEKVANWLDFTGLTDFADAYPKTLSGGMRQRVALARTMIVEPELLLLDEPFGALDERTRESMQVLLLKAVSNSGCSVLLVTHDIREALIIADRVFLMSAHPGRILDSFVPPSRKPRTRDHLTTPEFKSLYNEILNRFPVQVLRE